MQQQQYQQYYYNFGCVTWFLMIKKVFLDTNFVTLLYHMRASQKPLDSRGQ